MREGVLTGTLGAFDSTLWPAVLVGPAGDIVAVNPAWARGVRDRGGGAACDVGANYLSVCERAPGAAHIAQGLRDVLDGAEPAFELDYEFPTSAGVGWWRLQITPLAGHPGCALVVHVDLGDKSRAPGVAESHGLHDPLTGLPNRQLFLESLGEAVARRDAGLALFFLDVDDFKLINDGFGHAAGDDLLLQIAARLQAVVRPGDTVARLGGDEFTVLCHGVSGEAAGIALGERLLRGCQGLYSVAGSDRHVTFSFGVRTRAVDEDVDAQSLMRDADAAMYDAKREGKGQVRAYSDATRARLVERLSIEDGLRAAIATGVGLVVHYQPQVDLRSGRIIGAEALTRWTDRDGDPVSPAKFIPVAEETGLIVPLGDWLLETVCAQVARWDALGTPLNVTVNVSAVQLLEAGFADRVVATLERHGVLTSAISIELTESKLMGTNDRAVRELARLKDAGVYVAIDDFGTGYSSLSYLSRLPVEMLKIDRGFVATLGTAPEASSIIGAVMGVAQALGLHVIAEGVETEAQAEELAELGCTVGQGFLWSPAVPADELDALRARPTPRRRRRLLRMPESRGRRTLVGELMHQIGIESRGL